MVTGETFVALLPELLATGFVILVLMVGVFGAQRGARGRPWRPSAPSRSSAARPRFWRPGSRAASSAADTSWTVSRCTSSSSWPPRRSSRSSRRRAGRGNRRRPRVPDADPRGRARGDVARLHAGPFRRLSRHRAGDDPVLRHGRLRPGAPRERRGRDEVPDHGRHSVLRAPLRDSPDLRRLRLGGACGRWRRPSPAASRRSP